MEIKNKPPKIYLQITDADFTKDNSIVEWNDLDQSCITWSKERIYDTDVEYVLNK